MDEYVRTRSGENVFCDKVVPSKRNPCLPRLRCCFKEVDESLAQTARSLAQSPFTRIARACELTHLGISWVVCHLQYTGSLGMFFVSKLSLVPGGWSWKVVFLWQIEFVCTVVVEEVRLVAMKRVFGVKKDKTPGPTVEEATERVSPVSLFNFVCVCAREKPSFLWNWKKVWMGWVEMQTVLTLAHVFRPCCRFSFSCR